MHYFQLNEERKGHLGNAEVVLPFLSPKGKSKQKKNGQLHFEDSLKQLPSLLLLRFLFLHTLFFFELYFESYLIGTTIS